MVAYHPFANAAFAEHVGLMQIGEVLRKEYNVAEGFMPEGLAALLAQLDRSEQSPVITLGEICLRPFDRLDNEIRRAVIALFDK
jgi:hypothetical protein